MTQLIGKQKTQNQLYKILINVDEFERKKYENMYKDTDILYVEQRTHSGAIMQAVNILYNHHSSRSACMWYKKTLAHICKLQQHKMWTKN